MWEPSMKNLGDVSLPHDSPPVLTIFIQPNSFAKDEYVLQQQNIEKISRSCSFYIRSAISL
jgi:hypothetical protein